MRVHLKSVTCKAVLFASLLATLAGCPRALETGAPEPENPHSGPPQAGANGGDSTTPLTPPHAPHEGAAGAAEPPHADGGHSAPPSGAHGGTGGGGDEPQDGGAPQDPDGGSSPPQTGGMQGGSGGGGDQPQDGGQSESTSSSGSQGCVVTGVREIDLDESTPRGTPRQAMEAFSQALAGVMPDAIPLRWLPRFGGTTPTAIAIAQWGDKAELTETVNPACDRLQLRAALRFTTAGGVIDEVAQGSIRDLRFAGSFEVSGDLGRWLVASAGYPGLVLDSLDAELNLAELFKATGTLSAPTSIDDEELALDLYRFASFDSSWPRGVQIDQPYVRPAQLDAACAQAEPTALNARVSPGIPDLAAKLSRLWLRCDGISTGVEGHAGMMIGADGRWKHITYRDGAFVEQLGFGHEGTLRVLAANGGPGEQEVLVWDWWPYGAFTGTLVELSESANTLHFAIGEIAYGYALDGVYVASDLAVEPAPLDYASGMRAGAAACDKGEGHVHRLASPAELAAALSGSWLFCDGGFRDDATGIAFTADSGYRHLDAAGEPLAGGHYEVFDSSDWNGPGSYEIYLTDDDGTRYTWYGMLQSDAPLKLVGEIDARGTAVLSALP